MRIYKENGQTVIDQDDGVIALAEGIDPSTVNIGSLRPNTQVLSGLYIRAYGSRDPYDCAMYRKHKLRVLSLFHKRREER